MCSEESDVEGMDWIYLDFTGIVAKIKVPRRLSSLDAFEEIRPVVLENANGVAYNGSKCGVKNLES